MNENTMKDNIGSLIEELRAAAVSLDKQGVDPISDDELFDEVMGHLEVFTSWSDVAIAVAKAWCIAAER